MSWTIHSGGVFTFLPEKARALVEETSQPLKVKFGIDPTRDRLHLGHFVPLRLCKKLQKQGHKLDLVFGTLTAQLGDPSGRDKTRPILSELEVRQNAEKLLEQTKKFLLPGFVAHQNHEFVENMPISFFLTNLASKFTVASMLARDGFKKRHSVHQPIALHEFLVPLLQGWDSVVLRSEVEIGGSDQLFNFQVARRLQEAEGQIPEVCIMTPIIRGTDGRKMSKTFNNAIWLDEAPEEIFGKVMSIPDDVVSEWIPLLTDLVDLPGHPMVRKKKLALEIVSQIHDPEKAAIAQQHFESLIQNKEAPSAIQEMSPDFLLKIVALVRNESNNRARKLILHGGVSVNEKKILDPLFWPEPGTTIKIGKRDFIRII